MQEATMYHTERLLNTFAFRAGAEVAGSCKQLSRAPVFEKQHYPHLPNPRNHESVTQEQCYYSCTTAESMGTLQQLCIKLSKYPS
mmetsp:Transcript_113919/g.317223  ORF Transcript_113919/g.317223 Transcript_113919/m.317223 type:complete len:85 (+) Transcript_113919:1261-1515(+)